MRCSVRSVRGAGSGNGVRKANGLNTALRMLSFAGNSAASICVSGSTDGILRGGRMANYVLVLALGLAAGSLSVRRTAG
jgi:hypothetical protein